MTSGCAPSEARLAAEESVQSSATDRGRGRVLTGLALVEIAVGVFDRAGAHVTEACELFRRAGDRWALASTLWRAADLAFVRTGRAG